MLVFLPFFELFFISIPSAMLASYFLKEKQNLHGKIGCILSIIGSTVLVIHAPQEEEVTSMEDLEPKIGSVGNLIFLLSIIGQESCKNILS